ncbi:LANO_0B06194g1_1 [Lachancea nothofagi CBS 11611]|uniref:Coatomer subunit epsilon n=1 Tax=Lachancea nothofagi CBS 11611 TaxID=1266666 RepID=A0A1G4IZ75_9SACH|nr:LANO_0B06194g1_1 [Lachancea nothofagi CBS 11611]
MDLFSVKQQYYTGNFKEALSNVEKLGSSDSAAVEFYKAKCLQALNPSESYKSQTPLGLVFQAYSATLEGGDLGKLEELVDKHKSLFALNLWATAQATQGELESALQTCIDALASIGDLGMGATELVLLAVQISVLEPQRASSASMILQNFLAAHEEYPNEDEIIVNLAESYANFALGREISGSNFYFYEELCQTLPCWKSQLGLLSLHLQQKNIPEAQAIVDLLESDFYQDQNQSAKLYTPELIANKITLAAMQGEHVSELRDQLLRSNPKHQLCQKYTANNAKFDEIVAKYA